MADATEATDDTSDDEAKLRELWEREAYDEATTLGIETYGQEVYAFLVSRERAEDRAADVFSIATEDLWRSMPTFQWRCSLRTWFYRLARNAAVRYGKRPANQAARHRRMSQVPELVDKARSRTLVHLRTEVKTEFDKLRDKLSPEDQALLVLRVDRQLAWNDIARVMNEELAETADEDALGRASARMRQRFQKLKKRLRTLAEEHGLLEHSER